MPDARRELGIERRHLRRNGLADRLPTLDRGLGCPGDFIAPVDMAGLRLLAELPDQVTYVEVAKAGHALLPEQPVIVAKVVGEYFDDLREGR